MNSHNYDVCILGLGIAGVMSCLRIANEYKELKVLGIEYGVSPSKRKHQICGWLGASPGSDLKWYQSNLSEVSSITGNRRMKKANSFVQQTFKQVNQYSIIKDTVPNKSLQKKIKKLNFDISTNDYVQMFPKEIHALSKLMVKEIEKDANISFSFNNEIYKIMKQKGGSFLISTEKGDFHCKKIILATGRASWRWLKDIYSHFGIIENNDWAKFGLRVEMGVELLKEFNQSNCKLKRKDITVGPFNWNGTILPEDHFDLAISAFRSNEPRWHSDKVSFPIIGNRYYPNQGIEQADRIGKLTFILANDRILKERMSSFMNDKSTLSVIPEYAWLKDTITELQQIMPDIHKKSYIYVPTLICAAPAINVGSDLSTEVENLYVAGEAAGVQGLLAAACMGVIAADEVAK